MSTHPMTVFADYHQFYIWDAGTNPEAPDEYDADDIKRRVKVTENVVVVQPERNMTVPVQLEVLDAAPLADDSAWEHVVDCSVSLPSGALQVHECTGGAVLDLRVAPGDYAVRVSMRGLNTLRKNGLEGDDEYRVQLWPGRVRPLSVTKQGLSARVPAL